MQIYTFRMYIKTKQRNGETHIAHFSRSKFCVITNSKNIFARRLYAPQLPRADIYRYIAYVSSELYGERDLERWRINKFLCIHAGVVAAGDDDDDDVLYARFAATQRCAHACKCTRTDRDTMRPLRVEV